MKREPRTLLFWQRRVLVSLVPDTLRLPGALSSPTLQEVTTSIQNALHLLYSVPPVKRAVLREQKRLPEVHPHLETNSEAVRSRIGQISS